MRHRPLTSQLLAWLALIGLLVAGPTLEHHHEASGGAAAIPSERAAETAWTPDAHHHEHSTQWGVHAAPCGVCRVVDASVLPGASNAGEAWVGRVEGPFFGPLRRAANAKTRRHPPRAPPTLLLPSV